jgi:hypothetical protein
MTAPKFKIAFQCLGLIAAVILGSWLLSYRSYGIVAREAYSGIGTELTSVRGLIVFYYFDNYDGSPPPQEWSWASMDPKSREGQRLKADFDFWQAPHWWSRMGFFFVAHDPYIRRILLISVPYWFLFLMTAGPGVICYLRFRRVRLGSTQAGGVSANDTQS